MTTRLTARYARLATCHQTPDGDWTWDRTAYSPVWETREARDGQAAVYASVAEAEAEVVSYLTDYRQCAYTEPTDVAGWGLVIDVHVDPDRIERYAIRTQSLGD